MDNPVDLFIYIKRVLREHEEPYVDGAWEAFVNKNRKRKVIPFWLYFPAASIIFVFLLFSLYTAFFTYENNSFNQNVTKVTVRGRDIKDSAEPKVKNYADSALHSPAKPFVKIIKPALPINKNSAAPSLPETKPSVDLASAAKGNRQARENRKSGSYSGAKIHQPVQAGLKNHSAQNSTPKDTAALVADRTRRPLALDTNRLSTVRKPQNLIVNGNTPIPLVRNPKSSASILSNTKANKDSVRISPFITLLKSDTSKSASLHKKWLFGLNIVPSLSNLNTGLEEGINVNYIISDRLSVSSGLAYAALSASQNNNNQGSNQGIYLQSVDARVAGVIIPLTFKYLLGQRYYTTIGFSSLSILNQGLTKNYVEQLLTTQTQVGPNGIILQTQQLSQRPFSEKAPNDQLSERYVNFIKVSFGYRIKVFNAHSFHIEPALNIPIKTFSPSGISFLNLGLNLGYEF